MTNLHIKKNDEVVVLRGAERGRRGRVITVLRAKNRVIVEGLKMIKRHQRKSQQHPNGTILTREGTIHASNVMLASRYDARAGKRGAAAPSA